jgi:hypothetical protein
VKCCRLEMLFSEEDKNISRFYMKVCGHVWMSAVLCKGRPAIGEV